MFSPTVSRIQPVGRNLSTPHLNVNKLVFILSLTELCAKLQTSKALLKPFQTAIPFILIWLISDDFTYQEET